MSVVVTGGAGFIGANLVRHLVTSGAADEVVIVDDLSTGSAANIDGLDGARLLKGSILDPDVLDDACVDATCIVHLAARPSVPRSIDAPMASHHANATGTLEVFEAARRAGNLHTVIASSSSVYGDSEVMPKQEEHRPRPRSPYAVSKLAGEGYARAYEACYGLPVLPLRFFNVFGPLQTAGHAYAAAIPAFIDAALDGRPIPINGDGEQTRDFTYVGTVAGVIEDAVRRRVTSSEPVNLAFGTRMSLLQVVDALRDVLGVPVATEHGPDRLGDVRHSRADARRLLHLFPEVAATPFDEGLRETVRWARTGEW